ncbi:MAG: CDP-alcohol phosphatidyltransferase family protein [Methanosarcinales archaeon]|nr:CDP-alcohol phosphatidyltransferase family protein [Methanosarcinales archaeon]
MKTIDPEAGVIRLLRLPDLITIVNILFGFASILSVLNGDAESAIIFILAAALADGVDGAVARRVEFGIFGEHLDSFADIISFGIAPATIFCAVIGGVGNVGNIENIGEEGVLVHTALVSAVAAAYLICGTLRLVRFSILDVPEFRGLPITAAGTFAVLLLYMTNSQYLVSCIFVVLSALMISNVTYPKVRSTTILIPLAIVFVLAIAGHFSGFYNWFALVLFILVGIYVISPLIGCGHIFSG